MNISEKMSTRVLATRLILLAILCVFVEAAPRAGLVSKLVLPPLSEIAVSFWGLLSNQEIWHDFFVTMVRVLTSFLCAVIAGIPIGLALWRMPRVYALLAPYLGSYYALPIFAFYPILIALFGLGATAMILVGFMWAFIAMAESTAAGFKNIPETFHRIGFIYRLSTAQKLFRIYIPAAAPALFNGVRLAASYSMIGIVASEFILSTDGLGRRILFYFQDFQLDAMYACIVLVMVFQISLISSIGFIERGIGKHRSLA